MYDAKMRLMIENSLDRYKIGSADNLKAAPDGSVTIYIQAARDFLRPPGVDARCSSAIASRVTA
jgi:hypothetical protein